VWFLCWSCVVQHRRFPFLPVQLHMFDTFEFKNTYGVGLQLWVQFWYQKYAVSKASGTFKTLASEPLSLNPHCGSAPGSRSAIVISPYPQTIWSLCLFSYVVCYGTVCVQMVSHPEVMRTLLNSPFVQQMMSSPDLMRQLMSTNPQLCEVMEVTAVPAVIHCFCTVVPLHLQCLFLRSLIVQQNYKAIEN